MAILSTDRFLRTMARTAKIINAILQDVSQEQAQNAWDGDWNTVAVMCHLRDFEAIFFERARLMDGEDNPALGPVDHEALATENDYNHQQLSEVLREFNETRAAFLEWLHGLTPEQFKKTGTHPEHEHFSIFEQVVQIGTHDVDHLEQMVRMLNKGS